MLTLPIDRQHVLPRFRSWQEAHDHCQQRDRMVLVRVITSSEDVEVQIHPTGLARTIRYL